MGETELRGLSAAVEHLLAQESFPATVARLREELARSRETFVWATVELASLPPGLPEAIRSGWIFHLRRDVPSGAHYHPNSIQHMGLVSGRGTATVGGLRRRLVPFGAPDASPEDRWLVIGQGVAHEFVPEGEDMTVVSFHTCAADELEEVHCETGGARRYEGPAG